MSQTAEPRSPKGDRFATVFRAARKRAGWTQAQVAEKLGIAQGTVSRFESGMYVPDIFVWLDFCRMMEIPERSCEWGYIDWLHSPREARLEENKRVGLFRIPARYARWQGSSARQARPLLDFARNRLGDARAEELVRMNGMDPDYLADLQAPISSQFALDLASMLIKRGDLRAATLDPLVKISLSGPSHGRFYGDYEGAGDAAGALAAWARNQAYYEFDHQWTVDAASKRRVDLVGKARDHVTRLERDPDVTAFMTRFQERYFEQFAHRFGGPEAKATAQPGEGADDWIVRVRL